MATVLLILLALSCVAAAAAAVRLRAPAVPAGGEGDAGERWRQAHRERRVRERWLAPTLAVASPVVLVIAAGFALLGLLVSYFWLIAAFVCFYSAMRLKGVRPFQGAGGSDTMGGYYGGDGGGGDGGGSC
jgi:hypothetical protein